MKDIQGCEPGPLPNFRPVLREWIAANHKYCDISNWKDVPWGYNERAALSTLAGAFWLADGVALEEYIEVKRDSSLTNRRKRSSRGRCDLYLASKKNAYILEAKILWTSLTSESRDQRIVNELDRAREDVRRTKAHNNEQKLGLLFVVPYVRAKTEATSDKHIKELVEFLKNRKDICSAWVFPGKARYFHWSSEKDWLYPGTAMLLKPLRRR